MRMELIGPEGTPVNSDAGSNSRLARAPHDRYLPACRPATPERTTWSSTQMRVGRVGFCAFGVLVAGQAESRAGVAPGEACRRGMLYSS